MEDSLSNRMFEIAVNVPWRQLSLCSTEELVCIKTGSCDPWCSKHARARSNPSHQLFSVKMSFVPVSPDHAETTVSGNLAMLAAVVSTEQAFLGGDKDGHWSGLNESEEEDWLPSIHFFLLWAPPSLIMTTLSPIKCVWALLGEIPLRGISYICKGCNYERMCGTRSTHSRCHQAGS